MSAVNETRIEGLTTSASTFGPKETMDRLEAEIRTKGMEVFARIDHAAGAADVGLNLRPTELIIFGNAPWRHSSDAVSADNRNRSAVEGTRLGGRSRQNVDFI
jgi:hypothetical protein